jgi:hypothetical protein
LPGDGNQAEMLAIGVNRKLFAFAVLFFGVMGIGVVTRELSNGTVGVAVGIVILFGGLIAYYARGLLRRGPAIVVDADGLVDRRSGRTVRWATMHRIVLRKRQGAFGEYHHLVFTAITGEVVDVSIDQLSLGWQAIVSAVEERAGRSVAMSGLRGQP